jgi:hypothetical protein
VRTKHLLFPSGERLGVCFDRLTTVDSPILPPIIPQRKWSSDVSFFSSLSLSLSSFVALSPTVLVDAPHLFHGQVGQADKVTRRALSSVRFLH